MGNRGDYRMAWFVQAVLPGLPARLSTVPFPSKKVALANLVKATAAVTQ